MNWEPQANVLQELQHLLNGVGNANNAHHREVLEVRVPCQRIVSTF